MTTKINQAKTLEKHISCDSKCKFNSTACNSYQKWNNVICHCEWKKYHMFRKNYSWNSRTCICENSRNLKGIVHDLVIVCDEIINVTYSVSKNVTSTIPKYYTNKCVTSTVSVNCDDKNVMCEKTDSLIHTISL